MEYSELMQDFIRRLNVADARADADGAYHFVIDDMPISFMEVADRRELVVWGEVGELPPGNCARLYRTMLEAMFMGEGTLGNAFSIDRESGRVCLQRIVPLAVLDPAGFRELVERFANVLEEWRKLVADFREVAPELERAEPMREGETGNFGLGGFMRV